MARQEKPQNKNTPRLIILSAPSGAGKTTLCRKLFEEFPDKYEISVSCTTRSPRPGEVDGKDYHFITVDEFKEQMDKGFFAEWALVHGSYYGTSKKTIEAVWAKGKSVLLGIDVQGAASLRKAFPGKCFTIFVTPPSLEVLEQRLRDRKTDAHETIQKRIQNAQEEMKRAKEFDAILVNDTLEHAYKELKELIRA